MSLIGAQLQIDFGVIDPGEMTRLEVLVKETGFSGTIDFSVEIQPYGWLTVDGETSVNNTAEAISYVGNISAESEDEYMTIDVGVIADAIQGIEVGYVKDVSFTPDSTEFNEPFTAKVSLDYGDSSTPGSLVTTDNTWVLTYLTSRDEGFTFIVSTELYFTLDRSTFYSSRGFRLTNLVTVDNTSIFLNTGSAVHESLDAGETGYYGLWIMGDDGYDLWIDLTGWETYSHLPPSDSHGNSDYQYIAPGTGVQKIDLSQFDTYLGSGIVGIAIEADIYPTLG